MVKPRLIRVMNEVYVARIRLEGQRGGSPAKMFATIEQARGRVLADLLLGRPMWNIEHQSELVSGERKLAKLQAQLWTANAPSTRKATLDQIFLLETDMAPASTEFFRHSQTARPHRAMALSEFQRSLRSDEILLEFALLEPSSYCLVVTRDHARVQKLSGHTAIAKEVRALLADVRSGKSVDAAAQSVGSLLLGGIPELAKKTRVVIVPDSELHGLPFELVRFNASGMLLQSHVITYTPSASVLALLRHRDRPRHASAALAVSATPVKQLAQNVSGPAPFGAISRGVFDRGGTELQPLQSSNDEARAVVSALGNSSSRLLLGDDATEAEVKREKLDDYAVLHFAVHGLVSTKFPERSALVLRYDPGSSEDGFLQAREILNMHLKADLVTLSACESGGGAVFGQEGVSSLVRPFLAAGARSVVANLWAADDSFSLALIREFYRNLASGKEKAVALQQAKLTILRRYGPEAVPRLWSGLVLFGDGVGGINARP